MLSRRGTFLYGIALTAGLDTTPEIDVSHQMSGSILLKATTSINLLTFYAAVQLSSQVSVLQQGISVTFATHKGYAPMFDLLGNTVTLTVIQGQAYPLPGLCFYYGAIRIVVNAPDSVDIIMKG